ncbi:gluconate 2-dehydrogenase subunit 3 family protein [Paenibacillus xerothermodurans]|uniref:gluconate 2-dehydrogenase subunit 3 family protein n=1 Tax=Paenibacillus xerothermodurans TaxID=1977292 RepID=UPI001FB1A5B4|nr:gluconate 2-dehydrogenase subunit 3 family protein [Paenibacillus xerothermodurans]
MSEKDQPQSNSRRNFLKNSGIAIGGAVIGGAAISSVFLGRKTQQAQPAAPKPVEYNQALMFFNQEQYQITEAAAERIFPKDELGPGAKELGVAFYIDHQLASPWGINARDYMMGPFVKGEPTQGNQSQMRRADLFLLGLQGLKDYSQKKYNKDFQNLAENEQNDVLKVFEKGEEFTLNGATTKSFFSLLRSYTIEGVYSDPMYGGNKDMMGWKMRNYPGNQMSYTDLIEKDEFIKMEPMSLRDHMSH